LKIALAGTRDNGNAVWFSQKHKAFGDNVQFLSARDGTPLWVSDVEPGSIPDITAARIHVLPALYKAPADGLPTPADNATPPAAEEPRAPTATTAVPPPPPVHSRREQRARTPAVSNQ
jgi:hypothetical protein